MWESREVWGDSGTLPRSSVLGSLQGLCTATSRLGRKLPIIFPRWPSLSKQNDLFCQLPRSAFLLFRPLIVFVWPFIAPVFDLCKCTHKNVCRVVNILDHILLFIWVLNSAPLCQPYNSFPLKLKIFSQAGAFSSLTFSDFYLTALSWDFRSSKIMQNCKSTYI